MIIHLAGADTYRSAQRLAELRTAFIAKHDPQGFNTVFLDGSTVSPEELHQSLTASGFFAAKRFVVLDGYKTDAKISPSELVEALQPFEEKDSPVIVVVREVESGTFSSRRNGRSNDKRSLKKKSEASTVSFPHEKLETFLPLTAVQTANWVMQFVKERKATMVRSAADRLVGLCNGDMWRLSNELEKVLLYAGQRPVTLEDIEQLVTSEYSTDIFALTDALGQQHTARALELLHRELASGTSAFSLLATLANHIKNLWQVQRALERGVATQALASELGLHPFVAQKAAAQSKTFSQEALRRLHHRLLTIDHDLKTSPLDAETLLSIVVVTS